MKPQYRPILATFERLAQKYSNQKGMEEVNRLELAPVIREWEGRILDVGAGTGALIEKYLDPKRHEVVAVDFSANMLSEMCGRLEPEAGRSVFPVRALAQALPFPRDSFDAVVSVNTLHNMPALEDIRQALAEMARVVRPRGVILTEFRNSENPRRKKISEIYDKEELPQKSFSFDEIKTELERLGLVIERFIPVWGEHPESSSLHDIFEKIKRTISGASDRRAPRFAVVAEKGPGFRSVLRDALGYPEVK